VHTAVRASSHRRARHSRGKRGAAASATLARLASVGKPMGPGSPSWPVMPPEPVRSSPPSRQTLCRECGTELHAPPLGIGFTGAEREPCPNCGSTSREYRVYGSVSTRVAVEASVAAAAAPAPSIVVRNGVESGEFTRTVTWSKTEGDCWFAEVFDRDGERIGVEVGLDGYDVLVVLSDYLLPPEVE
jgi:hypothetical protein